MGELKFYRWDHSDGALSKALPVPAKWLSGELSKRETASRLEFKRSPICPKWDAFLRWQAYAIDGSPQKLSSTC